LIFDVDVDGSTRALIDILPLCRQHKLTSYDATYLELALRRNLPLATLDSDLRKVAKILGVVLLGL
jgi:predicted nucleic acid-binding protein